MKILTTKEIVAMGGKSGMSFYLTNQELVDKIKTLTVGEGILLEGKEWNHSQPITTKPFTVYFQSINSEIRISTKKLDYGKEYLITRIA